MTFMEIARRTNWRFFIFTMNRLNVHSSSRGIQNRKICCRRSANKMRCAGQWTLCQKLLKIYWLLTNAIHLWICFIETTEMHMYLSTSHTQMPCNLRINRIKMVPRSGQIHNVTRQRALVFSTNIAKKRSSFVYFFIFIRIATQF